jgi:hypothetical protein
METCLREALRRRQGTLLVAFFNIPKVDFPKPRRFLVDPLF